ncbi:MAG: hypothetical protein J1F09_01230 [Oscillospiraceae bacterium]|nr:hypothetical protein [Oscillospiraceae bacterium]
MLNVILILVLAVYFSAISWRLRKNRPEERTTKITRPLSIIINLSPLIGIAVFAVLFTFILKGRLLERVTHAFLVFAFWIYATRFYQYILSNYKKKDILFSSIIGMIFSILLAVIFTPLDRYVSLIYSYLDWYSIFLGCGLYIIFYLSTIIVTKSAKQNK